MPSSSSLPGDPRPRLGPALTALLNDVCQRVPAFSGLKADRILVVAGAARDTSRATVRWLLETGTPRVLVDGHVRHFEITLRPLFFLKANGLGRLITLFHELFHLEPDGSGLADERRHKGNHRSNDVAVESLARSYVDLAPASLLAPLGHEGEVLMDQWRIRPSPECALRQVTREHLFLGPVPMHTPKRERCVWW